MESRTGLVFENKKKMCSNSCFLICNIFKTFEKVKAFCVIRLNAAVGVMWLLV